MKSSTLGLISPLRKLPRHGDLRTDKCSIASLLMVPYDLILEMLPGGTKGLADWSKKAS